MDVDVFGDFCDSLIILDCPSELKKDKKGFFLPIDLKKGITILPIDLKKGITILPNVPINFNKIITTFNESNCPKRTKDVIYTLLQNGYEQIEEIEETRVDDDKVAILIYSNVERKLIQIYVPSFMLNELTSKGIEFYLVK